MHKLFGGIAAALIACSLNAQTAVHGRVQDGAGAGVPHADVQVGDLGLRASTDAQGDFLVRTPLRGQVRFQVEQVGFALLDTTILFAPGDSTVILRMRSDERALREVHIVALRAGDRAPFAKSTLTKEEIARMNTGVDLPYLLDLQPSVVVTSDAGTGIGYTGMRIRGTDATRTNITVNGVPFNDAESQGAFLVNMPDLASSTEDIEVQRGVGSSTNGPAAFGATVNLRTTRMQREAWGLVSATGGSYNTQRYAVAAGTGLINDHFSLDARLSSITSDGYIDRASSDLKSYFLQGAWIGRTNSLRFVTFRGKEVTYQAWDGVPREVIDTNRTYNVFTYDNQVDDYDQTHYQALFEQRIGSKAVVNLTLFRVVGQGFYEQYKEEDDLATYGIAPAVINGDTITTTDLVRRRWLDNTLTGANVNADITLGHHKLVAGGSYNVYEGDHFGEVIWARYAGDGEIRDRYYDNHATKTDGNVFAKFMYALGDHIDLYGDAQVRQVSHEFLGFNNELENITQRVEYTFFNPKAGAIWRMVDGGKAYASFAVANREPNRNDLEETTPLSRPSSERLFDYELGYERRTGRWSAGINAYYMDYLDQLVLTGELNDVGAALRTNVKSSYRAGLELMASVRPVERLTWHVNATLSANRIRDFNEYVDDWDNGGQVTAVYAETDLAFSPSMIAGSELTYRVRSSARTTADVSFITKYVGEQFLDNTASTERMLDAYVVNDLRLNVALLKTAKLKRIDFNLTVRNLFSEVYESNGWVYSYMYEGHRQESVGLFPQAPLNVLGGVTVQF